MNRHGRRDCRGSADDREREGTAAQPTLTPREFAQKWGDNATKEKAASQEHFIDLCRMLGEPTPNEADPTGQTYALLYRFRLIEGEEPNRRVVVLPRNV